MADHTIFTETLQVLGVKHTVSYSDRRFNTMSFKSLFGFSKLLQEYGVENEGLVFDDKATGIKELDAPFLARSGSKFVIVTGMADGNVTYIDGSKHKTMPRDRFTDRWSGEALALYCDDKAIEPDYRKHVTTLLLERAKRVVLWALGLALIIYALWSGNFVSHPMLIVTMLLDCVGLFLCFLLVQKSLKIKNDTADVICGVIQAHGCDHVLETDASKFFGLFSWSEVGFAYFSVSLLTLLIFPQYAPYLAAVNVCCLPFSFWSVWYQKFIAQAWCTLCLSVQAVLWLLFISYYFAGSFNGIFPLHIEFFVLCASYVFVLLVLNIINQGLDKSEK
ncbi:MAG: vitamin K epoxide reductase family protein [Muribaculaceae bacterium]|nr:vitamin K epoxide reductase family protein [Muribaculaceae bacterium]